jgi:hypothetical protein
MSTALVPTSFGELMQISEMISGARGLVPRHVQSPAHAAALIMRGAELGLRPMESLSALHLIDGKVTLSADTMLRVAIAGGVQVSYPEFTSERVTVELTRSGFKPFRCTWDLEMARRAGLAGRQNYKKFPRAMLRARAISEAVRAFCPDLLSGAYLPEELSSERAEIRQEETPQAAPEPEPIEDAEIVETPSSSQEEPLDAIGDREELDALFSEQIERAIMAPTIQRGDRGGSRYIREAMQANRGEALNAFHKAAWSLIMPRTIDEYQARKLLRRLRTEDGQKGLRHNIYKRLHAIVERMEEDLGPQRGEE